MALGALLLCCSFWCWDASDNADGYRLYWSAQPLYMVLVDTNEDGIPEEYFRVDPISAWYTSDMIETTELCLEEGLEPLQREIIFYTVTAFNQHGESAEEHGEVLP